MEQCSHKQARAICAVLLRPSHLSSTNRHDRGGDTVNGRDWLRLGIAFTKTATLGIAE